jgi:GlpG protein
MRKIGHLEGNREATRLSDFLYSQGIDNEVEAGASGGWDIWVHDEEQLDASKQELAAFCAAPDAEKYHAAGPEAEARRREETEADAAFKRKVYDREKILKRSMFAAYPVTMTLIVISVVVTLLGGLGSGSPLTRWLSITESTVVEGAPPVWDASLPEIRHGQVWRLITPIFIHASLLLPPFGLLHILFNMLWLKDLGQMLEKAQGRKGLLIKVGVLAALSNLGQFAFGGPAFGGMSGVVFGLLGYAWMRGRFDVTSGLFVHNQTIMMMSLWFFVCLFGTMGPIANGAHGVGLVAGTIWGYVSAHHVNSRKA